jgi:hypothetical protein
MFRRLCRSWLPWLLKRLRLKRSKPVPLTAGVLIIGSLFWESERGRAAWRDARLNVVSAQTVSAPIRYGRRSGTRGNSYTMVFSRQCSPGRAKLVPCSHAISTLQDLIAEAECLWKAEEPDAQAHRIASTWGCVAVLCHPERTIPEDVLRGWADRVSREPDYGRVSQTKDEGILVGRNDGLLRIEWPRLAESGAAADFDLLLVTANDPRISASSPTYPTAQAIAEAWNRAGHHVEYFWNNIDSGICTFEDDRIRALLRPREPGRV